jgi:hypothetical protein
MVWCGERNGLVATKERSPFSKPAMLWSPSIGKDNADFAIPMRRASHLPIEILIAKLLKK